MSGIDLWTDLRCPQCGATARVKNLVMKAARMHRCPKLRGLIAPMVREDIRCEVVVNDREDYVGKRGRDLQLDPELKRPVMNMVVNYADGRNDCTVYAPTARASLR